MRREIPYPRLCCQTRKESLTVDETHVDDIIIPSLGKAVTHSTLCALTPPVNIITVYCRLWMNSDDELFRPSTWMSVTSVTEQRWYKAWDQNSFGTASYWTSRSKFGFITCCNRMKLLLFAPCECMCVSSGTNFSPGVPYCRLGRWRGRNQ